jgi:sugar phosphate isomerase/epimerase
MAENIALQLYSVRDLLPKDYEGTIRKIAAMGYTGVETDLTGGSSRELAVRLFKELNLKVAALHIFPPPVGDKLKEAIETLALFRCDTIVSGFGPDRYTTLDATRKACDEINQASVGIFAAGLKFLIHNHWWEYLPVEGTYPYKIMLERLDPRIGFEVDTYWVKTGGVDPALVVKEMGKRAGLLHIKDGPAVRDVPMVAIGDGSLDFPGILKANQGVAKWLIVEFDWCATDILAAVEKSCRYLKGL